MPDDGANGSYRRFRGCDLEAGGQDAQQDCPEAAQASLWLAGPGARDMQAKVLDFSAEEIKAKLGLE